MRTKTLVLCLVLTAGMMFVVPTPSVAELGCFVCDFKRPTNPVAPMHQVCRQVGHNESGDGIECEDGRVFGGWVCALTPSPCFNVESNGNGSGGSGGGFGGGGGGGSCTISPGEFCPPSCTTCNTQLF